MHSYRVLSPIRRNGIRYVPHPRDEVLIDLPDDEVEPLARVHAIDPTPVGAAAAATDGAPNDPESDEQVPAGAQERAQSATETVAPQMPDPLNINTATDVDLALAISGVSVEVGARIVAHRIEHGPFASVDDLTKVNGIGKKLVDRHRHLLTV